MRDDGVHDAKRLAELQALPLNRKIQITQTRLIEWYQYWRGKVCVSFSGGKDSTVLLNIAREIYPDIPAVFSNTGLEYASIQRFVRQFGNVDIVAPRMRFDEVVSVYGYPVISKEASNSIYYARRILSNPHVGGEKTTWRNRQELLGLRRSSPTSKKEMSQFNKDKWLPAVELPFLISHFCCDKTKQEPLQRYQREHKYAPIVATLTEESRLRKQAWYRNGCNAFGAEEPKSQPMSFWKEQDVLAYIVRYGIEIASVYGDVVMKDDGGNIYPMDDDLRAPYCHLECTGCKRTGCVYCCFGAHRDKDGEKRFLLLADYEPRQYEYAMSGGQWVDNPYYDPVAPKYDGDWKNWNPKQIWVPSKKGLGIAKVIDMMNEIYGKDFIQYQ